MRLKILRNLGTGLPPYREGDVRDVTDKDVADDLIKRSLAEETDEPLTVLDHKTGQKKVALVASDGGAQVADLKKHGATA